jgi:hypothetical protein
MSQVTVVTASLNELITERWFGFLLEPEKGRLALIRNEVKIPRCIARLQKRSETGFPANSYCILKPGMTFEGLLKKFWDTSVHSLVTKRSETGFHANSYCILKPGMTFEGLLKKYLGYLGAFPGYKKVRDWIPCELLLHP